MTPTRHIRDCFGTVLLCAALLCAVPLAAGDPERTHHTLKTRYFNIHYHDGLEKLAFRTAAIAEEVHTDLTVRMGWSVNGPTEVHILDSQDSANGLASVSPYPYVLIYATAPALESSLQFHDNWLYTLFVHEYTHIVHIQMQHGLPRRVNRVLGDIWLPNAMQPRWFIEGLAILMETHRTSRGRIRSSYYDMVLRTHALQDAFQNLSRASHTTVSWPRGEADYIYGGMFMQYLKDRFGESKLFDISHRYASMPMPFLLSTVFEEATGYGLPDLYRDFRQDITDRARETANRVSRQGITVADRLTTNAGAKGRPLMTLDGNRILLPMADGFRRSGIFELTTDGTALRRLVLSGDTSFLSQSENGTLWYVRTAPHRNIYRFRDLFSLSPGATAPQRLTHGLRVREASVSPQGDRVAMVVNRAGQTDLLISDGSLHQTRRLLTGTDSRYYYHPVFSPDGTELALMIRDGTDIQLALLSLKTETLQLLTDDDAWKSAPAFTPNGRYVLFVSDLTGIANIHAVDRTDLRIRRITNVITGVSSPAMSPDGQTLLFLLYSRDGWDLYRMPFDPDAAFDDPPSPPSKARYPSAPPPTVEPESRPLPVHPYNPLSTLRPRTFRLNYSHLPGQQVIGVATGIADAQRLHQITAEYQYELLYRAPSLQATYLYFGLKPTFQLNARWMNSTVHRGYLVNGEAVPWVNQALHASLGFSMNLMGLDENQSISFDYTLNHSAPRDQLDIVTDPNGPLPALPTRWFRCGLRLGWSWSNLYAGPFSVSTFEEGRHLSMSTTFHHPVLGGNQELLLLQWGWREYIPVIRSARHILAFQFHGGLYLSNPPRLAAFRAGGYPPQNLLSAVINEESIGLPRIRGYAPDSLHGDHFLSSRLEYRLPLWRPEWTVHTFPLFFSTLHAGVFTDALMMHFDLFQPADIRVSVGGELVWDLVVGFYVPLTLRSGYARGLMADGVHEFILVAGGTF